MTDEEDFLFCSDNEIDNEEADLIDGAECSAYEQWTLSEGSDEHVNIECKTSDIVNDTDPDTNFYSKININCEYYTEVEYNKQIKMNDALSIIHFNSRSLYTKLGKIKDYLSKFRKFNVVAVSETWLDDEKVDDMKLDGYELFTTNRVDRTGGGVALYIDPSLRSCKVKSMSKAVENILGIITVEIKVEKTSNILISCVYRTPGTSVDTFNEQLANLWDKVNNSKITVLCGDTNVDLLSASRNKRTTDFINTIYVNNLFPLITKPSRITTNTATLIDNIFINKIELSIEAGLLLYDLMDHLPVFAVIQNVFKKKTERKANTHIFTRIRTPEAIMALEFDLCSQGWGDVYATGDPNQAYETFLAL